MPSLKAKNLKNEHEVVDFLRQFKKHKLEKTGARVGVSHRGIVTIYIPKPDARYLTGVRTDTIEVPKAHHMNFDGVACVAAQKIAEIKA